MSNQWENIDSWNKIDPLGLQEKVEGVDLESSWAQLVKQHRSATHIRWFKYAASVMLIISFVAYLNFYNKTFYVEAIGSMTHHILPDSSEVWLKQGTKLHYESAFNNDERVVHLSGVAFFNVRKNPKKPFIIKSQESTVRVLGTSFVYQTGHRAQIQVVSGTVQFYTPTTKIVLNKNERAVLSDSGKISLVPYNVNKLGWKTQYFEFEDQPLNAILQTLSEYYGTNLTCRDCGSIRITATFDHKSLQEAIDILEWASNIKIDRIKMEKLDQ